MGGQVFTVVPHTPWVEALAAHFAGVVHPLETYIFMPTSRSAAALQAALAAPCTGILPLVLPLRGGAELAGLLGMEPQPVADVWQVRAFLATQLAEIAPVADVSADAAEALLLRRAARMQAELERLAAYGVTPADALAAVPKAFSQHGQQEGAVLVELSTRLEGWLAARGEVLAATAEQHILAQAAEILAARAAQGRAAVWMAGILDGTPAAEKLARVAATAGGVMVPEDDGHGGELAHAWLQTVGLDGVVAEPLAGPVVQGRVQVGAAESPLEEARMVALACRRALAAGAHKVGVVLAEESARARLLACLVAEGLVPLQSAGVPLAETPEGRRGLAAWAALRPRVGKPHTLAEWRTQLETLAPDLWGTEGALGLALGPVMSMPGVWSAAGLEALLTQAMAEICVPMAHHAGVMVLGPLEARLLPLDAVMIMGAVEGVWPPAGNGGLWAEPQLRALGVPDSAKRARLAASEWQGLVAGGIPQVQVFYAKADGGKVQVASRWVQPAWPQDEALLQAVQGRAMPAGQVESLGVFAPGEEGIPHNWSASFVEGLMACPYKVYAERVLKIEPLEPLNPLPDGRVGGLLTHAWLQRAAAMLPEVIAADGVEDASRVLKGLIPDILAGQDPLVVALWKRRMEKLAPAVASLWAQHGRKRVASEARVEAPVAGTVVTLTARFDRVERGAEGDVIVDYKTGTPPSWAAVESGEKPQLAVESWLWQQAERGQVAGAEFWQLKGYGRTLVDVRSREGTAWEATTAGVEDGVTTLAGVFAVPGAQFPALPDRTGGGLVASGVCEYCPLAGVCRRFAEDGAPAAVRQGEGGQP